VVETLADNPLLVLFAVVIAGSLVGRLRVGSFSLGISAVLFAGLAASAIAPELALPEIVYQLGLVLFVYTVGLASGPRFLPALRNGGLRLNGLVVVLAAAAIAETALLAGLLSLDPVTATGMFTGALTNTPALAGVVDALPHVVDGSALPAAGARAVVGYSLAYPIGVAGTIALMSLLQRAWRIDHAQEARQAGLAPAPLENWTVRVGRTDRPRVDEIARRSHATVTASRVLHGRDLHIPTPGEQLATGDDVALVGTPAALRRAVKWLGRRVDADLAADDGVEYRRVFVSNPAVVGVPLGDLHLPEQHGVTVTRIRRGDVDQVATADSVLELGDRVRLVAPKGGIRRAGELMGDSYKHLTELNVLTFAAGLVLGLLVGLIPIPLPGGATVHLGIAGGPLLVALVLGALGTTGPLVWHVPSGVNLAVRQIGIVLFLAGIGTRAGEAFGKAIADPSSLVVIGAGATLTVSVALTALVVAHRVLRVPFGEAMGMVGGLQTQPAVLAYADEQCGTELSMRGYTSVYPAAMIAKIIAAQVLLVALL
jgi:putative transport protein